VNLFAPSKLPSGSPRPTVAVIGAGFSGVLTAVHLLRAPDGPRVLLIERGPRFGRGAAYSSGNANHLLNVRGANMSALPDAPGHFLDWLGVDQAEGERVFVTRDRYGAYLQSLLREAAGAAAGRLALEHDDAVDVARTAGGWSVGMAMGRRIPVDAVVLAIGNLAPPAPEGVAEEVLASDRWVGDPWAWIEANTAAPGDVLLIGSGLTAVDVALSISEGAPDAGILALSRHGLSPRAHAPRHAPAVWSEPPSGSAREVWRQIRRAARDDWRAAIDGLRPHVQAIWRSWTVAERKRFLRHARPWWEISRHRLAPDVAAQLERLTAVGRFEVTGGRLLSVTLTPGGVEAVWKPRGGSEIQRRGFAMAINCAGPLSDVALAPDPLIGGLIRSGLARPDACRLGLDVDHLSRLIGAAGSVEGLFAVGPLTRGQVYEMTSVPDIRIQAADVARALLGELAGRATGPLAERREAKGDHLSRELELYLSERAAELDMEIEDKSASRRMRTAWELRGRRSALNEVAAWLEARKTDA
jgi:uncharacterized NAD(P)/FAD-binding protein YdhS